LSRRRFCSFSCAALASLPAARILAAAGAQSHPLTISSTDGTFVLRAPIADPFYAWPRTLLSFPLALGQQVSSTGHALECQETRSIVPFQVSAMDSAAGAQPSILFLSDLPAGANRTYRLIPKAAPSGGQPSVTIVKEERRLTVDTGMMRIRIPSSQIVQGDAPGPILEVSRGGNWFGSSKLVVDGRRIIRIETEQLEAGPLRSAHRITYFLDSGAKYTVMVECIAGMDFVRLHEDMDALPEDAKGEFDFAWTGCSFSHRQAPNHPYNFPRQPLSGYTQYPWEKIAQAQMDTQFGVSPGISSTGKMPFSLRLFEPWSDALAACFANFWSDDSPDAAAIFIDHIEQWEDHKYAIWHSSSKLAVDLVYIEPTLHFVWKIARGVRSTCLSFYDHAKDIEAMETLKNEVKGIASDGALYRTGLFPTSHALNLQNWYGTLGLNKAKDWELSYPAHSASQKQFFTDAPCRNASEFYQLVVHSSFVSDLAISGVRQNNGFGPTSSRQILENWVPAYQVFASQLSPEQRRRVDAVFLLLAYVHAGEDYMPMRYMLAGHPNFLSDVKSTPCGMAFLYPDHPSSQSWADEFEAFLRLNSRYHTRPAVNAWGARGGRWTENLGTYVWAFLRPASRGAFLLKCRDGQERLCGPQLTQVGDWLVNALSAPFAGESAFTMKRIEEEAKRNEGARRHYWGIVSPSAGPRRLHPPYGAHSERRKTPRTMWYLGSALRNYSPLTSEHLMWAARPTDQDMEASVDQVDSYNVMFSQPDNLGTNPHFSSAKYTGYGITLRAAVDTPRELSIHLMQIDDGPNYRWGIAGEGGCGAIYFYANGKAFSHNGGEDIGDRIDQDTDFCTNFGVWKDGVFRSVGHNTLSRPLYDLSFAQYAELVPHQGPQAYSWPEYVSRGILLAGDDYFLIHDRVFNPQIAHRFSWFVKKGDDFPHISLLSDNPREQSNRFTSIETETTSGRWAEGSGDSLVLVTHKDGVHATRAPFGATISTPEGNDVVFLARENIHFRDGNREFNGTSGIIRTRNNATEFALFRGTHIAAGGLSFSTSDSQLGIAGSIANSGSIRGVYAAPSASEIEIGLPSRLSKLRFFIDGHPGESATTADSLALKLPAGTHLWELSVAMPVPNAPRVERTENTAGGAIVYAEQVASATSYVLEISVDNAQKWTQCGVGPDPRISVNGLKTGAKYHVRFHARNTEQSSDAGPEYPLYVTSEPPSPPDGLHVDLFNGKAEISWGEVLGVREYRLYRRVAGSSHFSVAYAGRLTRWTDAEASVPPSSKPRSSNSDTNEISQPTCDYYVTAVNHNGEGRPSRNADTNPTSWRNWNPMGNEPFRRSVERGEEELPNDHGGRYYPA
jgi:hypothetical protein